MGSNAENPLLEEAEQEEDEEALSLRDLPTNEENHAQLKALSEVDHEEEFNFLQFSKDSKMCAADEVFFQGQILPKIFTSNTSSRCFSRSGSNQSMDHFTSASSRSSSINSHRSSSSGSSSSFSSATTAAARPPHRRPKLHNQFQFSHPSPKPKPHAKPPSFKTGKKPNRSSPAPSTIWSFLRVGLVAPPAEIAMQDLKLRSSRNSSSGIKEAGDRKQESSKFPGKNRVLFNLSGCNCTANAVVGPVPSAPLNAITRNPTAKEEAEEDNSVELKKKRNDDDDKNRGTTRKQSVSRHRRTFEWLKQLSLEETALVIDDHNQQ